MGNLFYFDGHKKEIENIAEKIGFVKIEEDKYKIVLTSFYSNSEVLEAYLYNKFKNDKDTIFEKELIDGIDSLVTENGQRIEVTLKGINGNILSFQLDCLDNNNSLMVDIGMSYRAETLDAFVALVANSITKDHVEVSMSKYVNWNELVKYVKKEKK